MRRVRNPVVCSVILVMLLGIATMSAPARATDGQGPHPADAFLVFVTKSDACNCVANLCVAGEQEVLNFLGSSREGLRYRRVDLAKDPEEGKKYRAVTLPVALLLDREGREIARFDSFFTEEQLTGVWEKYLATRRKQP